MTNTFLSLITAAMLVMAGPIHAHLGETLEQCGQRYGEPFVVLKDTVIYKKNGFEIGTLFVDGKVEAVTYKKLNKDGLFPEKISLNEIYQILKSNCPESKFTPKDQGTKWVFLSEDNAIYADYDTIKHGLGIMTHKGQDAIDEITRKKAEASTGGL